MGASQSASAGAAEKTGPADSSRGADPSDKSEAFCPPCAGMSKGSGAPHEAIPGERKNNCHTQPERKRICCVCKETKAARDECIVLNGEEKCQAFIDAHNQCLRSEGFDVSDKQ